MFPENNSPLNKRRAAGSLRSLRLTTAGSIDFCSNDYLGFARSKELSALIGAQNCPEETRMNGSTGSRLLSGNSLLAEELEESIAGFHGAESALIFNSGYDANLGLFSCMARRTDTILYDELSHASIIDGVRLSTAHSFKFRHNDLYHLEELLKKSGGTKYVGVEAVYSMGGDFAPLPEMAVLCEKYDARLIVDEAHATGVFGKKGEGRVAELALENSVFARMHTFGKALGVHGAVVLGNAELKTFLVNFSRPFIYSTALPGHSLLSIHCAYQFLAGQQRNMIELRQLISFFREGAGLLKKLHFEESQSAIQCMVMPGNEFVRKAAENLQGRGYDVRAILSPTVAEGSERLRICLHAFNTREEVEGLLQGIEIVCL
jgi:8-amino-7-oxononanoate synthase